MRRGASDGSCGATVAWDEPNLGDADFTFETIRAVHFLDAFSSYNEAEVGSVNRLAKIARRMTLRMAHSYAQGAGSDPGDLPHLDGRDP